MKEILYKNNGKIAVYKMVFLWGLLITGSSILIFSFLYNKNTYDKKISKAENEKKADSENEKLKNEIYKKNEEIKNIKVELEKYKNNGSDILVKDKKDKIIISSSGYINEKPGKNRFIKIKNNYLEKKEYATAKIMKTGTIQGNENIQGENSYGNGSVSKNINYRRIGENIQSYELYWPVNSRIITSEFGTRNHPILKEEKFHRGVDIAVEEGENVYSGMDGIVTYGGEKGNYGNLVEIQRIDGLKVRYAHLSRIYVETGQQVKTGEKIGESGNTGMSTGPHLHYEVLVEEIPVNPMRFKYIN